MICPRCSVAEISPNTGACELCGYVPNGSVAVDAPQPDATDERARAELAHQFRIDVLLGQGAASTVYLAREQDSNRHIVLKVMPRVPGRPDVDARFRDAIAAASSLDHPHLVPVLRHGETDSLLWYSMEHRRARPLRDVLRTGGPLDLRAALRIISQIAGALDFLHRRGVVHGRVRPENVLVDAEQWVHVCDALIARAFHAVPIPQARETPAERAAPSAYAAPEESLGGFVGPTSDQYSLAVMLVECLTGAEPAAAPADPAAMLGSLRSDLPAHLTHALARALNPRPNDRYPTILDFVTALESGASMLLDARPSGRASDMILTVPDWEPPPRERPRWIRPALGGVAFVAIAAVAVVLLRRAGQPDTWREAPPPSPVVTPIMPGDSGSTSTPQSGETAAASRPALRLRPDPVPSSSIIDLRSRPGRGRNTGRPTRPVAQATPSVPRAAAPSPAPAAATPGRAPQGASAGEGGRIFVNASPWGQLYVDGQLIGNTPKANVAVSAGAHTIRVVREGYDPVERSIRVAPGEVVRLTDLVLAPHQP